MQHLYSRLNIKMLVLILLLGGCTAIDDSLSSEQRVTARAQERLDALMAGDLDSALEYTTPSFRQSITPRSYGARYAGAVNWTGGKVETVVCEEETCNVKVLISYQLARPRIENTRPLDEVWIRVDGRWYIYEE